MASAYSLLTINPKEVKRAGACALDGRLQNDAGRRIAEHYADTGGFTDHVFAACSILGFRFAPRIRDLADKRLYVFDPKTTWIQDIVPQQQAMRADLNGSQIDEAAGERI